MKDVAQAFRFLISGGTGFAIYYLVALLLRRYTDWPDGACATVATLFSVPPAFLLQKHFTFRHRGGGHSQLFGYLLLQGACALLVGGVAQACMRLGMSHYLGFFLGGASGVLVSWLVQRRLIFRHAPE